MATFKTCVYRNHLKQDGTYNVKLRVTHNRVTRKISTPYYVDADKVSVVLEIKDPEILDLCEDLCYECRKICRSFGFTINRMSVDELVATIEAKLRGDDGFRLDFCKYWERQADSMSPGTGGNYRTALRAFQRFIRKDSFDVSLITSRLIADFKNFIEREPSQRGANRKKARRGQAELKTRGVSMYIGCIRAIYNRAKLEFNDEDSGFTPISKSPFSKIKLTDPAPKKRALPPDVLQRIIDLPYKTGSGAKRYNLAKDCFILSFCLIGMNSVDLYNCNRLANGVLIYNRTKTRTRRADQAEARILLEPEVMPLIEKYRDMTKRRVFRFYHEYKDPHGLNTAINHGLKEIAADLKVEMLQFYAARHTWATVARSHQVNIEKATVHEALVHVDPAMHVTDIYVDRDWQTIWEANEKVLAIFKWQTFHSYFSAPDLSKNCGTKINHKKE